MKENYNKSVKLECITCGDSDFEYNDDKSWIKCNRCEKEYNGEYNELVELNQENISQEIEKTKKEVQIDLQQKMNNILKETFKGNKNIKFK
ncbi:hypothetical protein [Tenacibaculum soleae]|uniref:hypothetical protein n=1 Tax=Tenacibaculum soleae TaxID=447689 RepID=UPI0026E153FA|nr:hypothetical protein [Tenacibaculum soleae]MDO6812080.1 hypothetical protein [Tenacibaculum soleae]